jgi:N utilization substance protein B
VTDRRKAREIAVQTLYEMAHTEVPYARPLALNLERRGGGPEVRAYAERLLRAVEAHRDEIAARLREALRNWSLERVAMVDRCILEVGCAEILYFDDVPLGVAIDEAVEVARRFSTAESGSFVNGVLDRIAKGPQPADAGPAGEAS